MPITKQKKRHRYRFDHETFPQKKKRPVAILIYFNLILILKISYYDVSNSNIFNFKNISSLIKKKGK